VYNIIHRYQKRECYGFNRNEIIFKMNLHKIEHTYKLMNQIQQINNNKARGVQKIKS